jgi:hypothetical protein
MGYTSRPGSPKQDLDNTQQNPGSTNQAAPPPQAPPAESIANQGTANSTAQGSARKKNYSASTGGNPEGPSREEKDATYAAQCNATKNSILLTFRPNVVGKAYEGGPDAFKALDPLTQKAEAARLIAENPRTGNKKLESEGKPLNSEPQEALRRQIMEVDDTIKDANDFLKKNSIKGEAARTAFRTSAVINVTSHIMGNGDGPKDPAASAAYYITGRTENTPADAKGKARNLDSLIAEAQIKIGKPETHEGTKKNLGIEIAAIEAFKAAGYFTGKKYMPVVGVDATDAGRDALKQGTLLGTVLNDATNQGQATYDLAAQLATKAAIKTVAPLANKDGKPDANGHYIWVPYQMVTK